MRHTLGGVAEVATVKRAQRTDRGRGIQPLASAVAAVIVLASFSCLALACGGEAGDEVGPSTTPVTSAASPRLKLTPQEQHEVLAVIDADATLAPLLDQVSWRVAGDWSVLTPLRSWTVIGGGVTLRWSSPVSIDMQWPASLWDPSGKADPPYQYYRLHAAGDGLTAITVLVDLRGRRVVSVFPANPEAAIDTSPPADFEPQYPFPTPD